MSINDRYGSAGLEAIGADIRRHVAVLAGELRRTTPSVARSQASRHAIHQLVVAIYQCFGANARSDSGSAPTSGAISRDLRAVATSWPTVDLLLARQIPPERQPLYPAMAGTPGIVLDQIHMADEAFGLLHQTLNRSPQDDGAEAMGCYADVALPMSEFHAHIHAASRVLLAQGKVSRTAFLDVGCGGGLKPLVASRYFEQVAGVEYDKGYVERARHLFEASPVANVRVIEADALKFDGYRDFDVIYFYRPMRHAEMLARLERRIVALARPGTLLIAPYDGFAHVAQNLGCAPISGRLFVTAASAEDAEDLRQRAELIGTRLAVDSPALPDIWQPIVVASRARGYGA